MSYIPRLGSIISPILEIYDFGYSIQEKLYTFLYSLKEKDLEERVKFLSKYVNGDEERFFERVISVLSNADSKDKAYYISQAFHGFLYEKINIFYNETLIDGEKNTYSIKSEIAEAKKDILRDVKDAKDKLLEATKELKELKEFHIKVFGNNSEESSNNQNSGLDKKLDKFVNDFESFIGTSKDKTNNLHTQIEADLEGSTTLGLAKSFNELKNSFEKPVKLWNLLFIIAITCILIITIMAPGVNKSDIFYKQFLSLFPLIIPFIWLAMFAGKRRSENNRLKQEYAHKESVAKTCLDYKKQIEQLGLEDKELLIKLLSESINTISFNASSTLDKKHNEKTPYHEFASLLSEKGKELTGIVKKGGQ